VVIGDAALIGIKSGLPVFPIYELIPWQCGPPGAFMKKSKLAERRRASVVVSKMTQRIATQRWIQGSFAFVFIDVFPPEHSLRNGFTAYT